MGSDVFICEICGNKDPKYLGIKNGKVYCRRCISFKGREISNEIKFSENIELGISYSLTKEQERISNQILKNYINGFNQLIYAVCGAGKTEIVFKVMEYALKNKLHVGFAIPRKDVVIELARRFQASFKNAIVTPVYGGNTKLIEGDILCLTTHQLYRYKGYFDLLILDEIDAFPYQGNEVLEHIFKNSIKGNYVLMSATPSNKVIKEFMKNKNCKILSLYTRYHMKPIPVPKIKIAIGLIWKVIYIAKKLKIYNQENKPALIFVPTIYYCEFLYNLLKNLAKGGYFVHSKCENRNEIIDKFRENKFKYLVTTAVLERGVTLKNLQVIIFKADHEIYNSSSLIQISGRVGRKMDAPCGEVIFLSDKKTKEMVRAINVTIQANKHLQKLLQ